MIKVKAHIRNGKPVRAYTRGGISKHSNIKKSKLNLDFSNITNIGEYTKVSEYLRKLPISERINILNSDEYRNIKNTLISNNVKSKGLPFILDNEETIFKLFNSGIANPNNLMGLSNSEVLDAKNIRGYISQEYEDITKYKNYIINNDIINKYATEIPFGYRGIKITKKELAEIKNTKRLNNKSVLQSYTTDDMVARDYAEQGTNFGSSTFATISAIIVRKNFKGLRVGGLQESQSGEILVQNKKDFKYIDKIIKTGKIYYIYEN